MELGAHFIHHADWNKTVCNVMQLENGWIVTQRPITKNSILYMDGLALLDHEGNRVYKKGSSISPKPQVKIAGQG